MATLNEVYSSLSVRRRYEVWFLRMALADGSGAWWFRYLLMNPGRGGCVGDPRGAPAQIWATWFPKGEKPQSTIQGFPLELLDITRPGRSPFHFGIGEGRIEENSCRGNLNVNGHAVCWDVHYSSTFRVTLSNKGWIGFSRTPHSDAVFAGSITVDGRTFSGDPLGFGLQGHNCGYRHRSFWVWMHAFFSRPSGAPSTLEALVYNMPFGLVFRRVVLWHEGREYIFRSLLEETLSRDSMHWKFNCSTTRGLRLSAEIVGNALSTHHLPYVRTDCSGSFEVLNNSLASATLRIQSERSEELLETRNGAVLEIAGNYSSR